MIELKNISKDFGSGEKAVHAVRDVSLSIGSGEIFGIIGFSGAGKSTLVRCINLLERPSSGSVFVAGQDLTALSAKDLRAARKKIGMIFQHFNLMPSRTVAGNVAYPLKGSGLSKEDIQKKVATLLELVGIGDKADAYPSQLSGGQKQRVAIARALANDPQVLLCDEATSALDPQTTKAILHLLKHLNETLGITIVLITHEMAVVKEICDRVAVMEYGRVVEQGEVFTVFAEPKQDITKSFIHTTSNLQKVEELCRHERHHQKIDEEEDRSGDALGAVHAAGGGFLFCHGETSFPGKLRKLLLELVEELHRLDGGHRVRLGAADGREHLSLADRVETDLLGLLARLCLIRAALLELF